LHWNTLPLHKENSNDQRIQSRRALQLEAPT
jgi:hypothetical protein